MAFFFGDSFDCYALPADATLGYWDGGSTVFALAAGRFSGSRSINTATGTLGQLVKSSGSNDAVHHIVCAFQTSVAITGTTLGLYFQLTDGTTNQCCIVFRSDGAILLTSATPGGTILATYAGAFTATNTWYAFEFEVVINNTTGSFTVRKNGNTSNDFSATSLNTRPGTNAYANKLTIGTGGASGGHYLDDLLWRSDAASVPWVGDIRCFTRRPDTDASVAWSRPSTFQMQPYFGATNNLTLTAGTPKYTSFISQGGAIGSIVVNMVAGYTGNMKCAIYASSAGQPNTVIQSATAPISNPAIGANTFNFSPPVSIAKGTQYFVGICSDVTATTSMACGSAAPWVTGGFNGTTAYASFPASPPTGLSASSNGPVFPVVTPTYNADAVSEPYEDAAASYVYSSTVGQADSYNISAISSTPTTVIGTTVRGLLQKSDAGTRTVNVTLTSGGSTVNAAGVLNTTWAWVYRSDTVDPATGAAWTPVAVNNAKVGVSLTA